MGVGRQRHQQNRQSSQTQHRLRGFEAVHEEPFQRAARVCDWCVEELSAEPTAHTVSDEIGITPLNASPSVPAGSGGVGRVLQPWPFQWSVSGTMVCGFVITSEKPTAHTEAEERADTPNRRLSPAPLLGVVSIVHCDLLQCMLMVRSYWEGSLLLE